MNACGGYGLRYERSRQLRKVEVSRARKTGLEEKLWLLTPETFVFFFLGKTRRENRSAYGELCRVLP